MKTFSFTVGTIEGLDNTAETLPALLSKAQEWATFAHYNGEDGEINIWEDTDGNGVKIGTLEKGENRKWTFVS